MPLKHASIEPEALAELAEAVAFLEMQQPGSGERLVAAVNDTIRRICEYPEAWPPVDGNLRRCNVDGCSYWLVYSHTQDAATIMVVSHTSRSFEYWRARTRR